MIHSRKTEKGMTLIEIMVAGVISTIVAGTIFILWKSYNDQLRSGSTGGSLQMQYREVSGQIARYVRQSHFMLPLNVGQGSDNCQAAEITSGSIYFYDITGRAFAAILISGDTLYEYTSNGSGLNGVPFNSGGDTILVNSGTFTLNGCRNRVTMDLTIKRNDNETEETFTPGPEVFQCRN